MNFLQSLALSFCIYTLLIFLLSIDWLCVIAVLAIFLILRQKLKFHALGFWTGELSSLLLIDILGIYIAASIHLPAYAQDPAYAILQLIPAIAGSLVALIYFGRKKNPEKQEDQAYPPIP